MAEKAKNPHENHRERLRETFRKNGLDNMPDHNVLELLLFYSVPRKDTNELAHRLLDTFGSLSNVFNAPYERLLEVDGIGESSALLLSSMPALCRRYIEDSADKKPNLLSSEATEKFLAPKFYGCRVETFYLICLDGFGNLINCLKLGEGTCADVLVDTRAVMETVLRNDANSVIIAHNHPNGIAAPSNDDIVMTAGIASLLSSVRIHLIDHLIFAGSECISLASTPKLAPIFLA